MDAIRIGDLVRRYRVARGLTQEQLAARAGLGVRSISDLERGVSRRPQRSTVSALAQGLALADPELHALEAAASGQISPSTHLDTSGTHASRPALVGRHTELIRLADHLEPASPPLLLLSGPPGIGKTRLLKESRDRARASGWAILESGCHRRSGQEPYAPLVGALERHVRRHVTAERRRLLHGCAWLVRLLPELAETAVVPVPRWTLSPEQERRLMFDAIGRYLANAAGPSGTLLILDDLQWAGADAIDLITALTRATREPRDEPGAPGRRPLRILGAYRETEVPTEHLLAETLDDLRREGLAERADLGPLAPDAAAALLDGLLAAGITPLNAPDIGLATRPDTAPTAARVAVSPADRAEALARAEGIPLYLVSYARELRVGAGWTAGQVPSDVAQSIQRRVAMLGGVTRTVLGAAAVLGRVHAHGVLLAICGQAGIAEDETLAALASARTAGLLRDVSPDEVAFTHDLIREVVLDDMGAAARALWHRRAAIGLEGRPGGAPAAVLAHHFARAGEYVKAAVYYEHAGDHSLAVRANAEAESYYRESLALHAAANDQLAAAPVREKLAVVLADRAAYDQALVEFERALATHEAAGDMEGLLRVTARIGRTYALRGTPRAGIDRLRPLLERLERLDDEGASTPTRGLAALYLAVANLHKVGGAYAEQLTAAERAATIARAIADDRLTAEAEMRHGNALLMLGRNEEGVRVLERALPLIETAGDSAILAHALNNLGVFHEGRGDFERTHKLAAGALAAAELSGDPTLVAFMVQRRGFNAFCLGHWDAAGRDLERAVALAREFGATWATAYPLIGLGTLRVAQGRTAEGMRCLEEAAALAEDSGDEQAQQLVQNVLAERDLVAGRPADARARIEPWLAMPEGERDVTMVLPLLAWAYVDLGDDARAEAVLARAEARVRDESLPPSVMEVSRVRALLAIRQGRRDDAIGAIEQALTIARSLAYPHGHAKSLYTAGLVYLRDGKTEQARACLTAARTTLGMLGERLYGEPVEDLLASLPDE